MAKPEKVIDNEPMTKAELARLHDDIDWHDRQSSIEYICDEIDHLSEHATPSELWNMIKIIREEFSEFIE